MEPPKIVIPNNSIYKVHILDTQGKISVIIVYSRNETFDEEWEEKLAQTTLNLADDVSVVYSKQQILPDDSIRIIKKKILMDLTANAEIRVSYEEMYLYASVSLDISPKNLFLSALNQQERENPTLADKGKLYFQSASRLLASLGMSISALGGERKHYSLNEFEKAFSGAKRVSVYTPLGPQHVEPDHFLFSANPYLMKHDKNAKYPLLEYFENKLLMNHGDVVDGNLYLCLAENVLTHYTGKMKQDKLDVMMNLYFRLLYNKNVRNAEELFAQKGDLVKHTKSLLDDKSFRLYDAVQVFYDTYTSRKGEHSYLTNGLKKLHLRIIPEYNNILPLEIIFKSIHATKSIPFIKYSQGERREKVYRLYYRHVSRNGKKIPFLPEKQINKLVREMGKSGQVSMYIQTQSAAIASLYLHFELGGKVSVECVFGVPTKEAEAETLLKELVNPVLSNVNAFLEPTGFFVYPLESLRHSNVSVVAAEYVASVRIDNKVDLKKLGCIHSVFNVFDDNVEKGAKLMFKRVDNYSEMDAKAAFISAHILDIPAAIAGLVNNFNMSEVDAKVAVAKFYDEHTDHSGRVVDNHGFPVSIVVSNLDNVLEFSVSQITSLKYLDVLTIYFDSIIRITQNIRSTAMTREYLRHICAKPKDLEGADVSHIKNVEPIYSSAQFVAPVKQSTDFDLLETLGISPEKGETNVDEIPEEIDEVDEGVFFDDDDDEIKDENDVDETNIPDKYGSIGEIAAAFMKNIAAEGAPPPTVYPPEGASPPTVYPPKDVSVEGAPTAPKAEASASADTSMVAAKPPEGAKPPIALPTKDVSSEDVAASAPKTKSPDDDDDDDGAFFSDYEEEDNDDEQDGGVNGGDGEDEDEKYKINPTGMSLNNPNPFLRKMKKLDPTLFLTKKEGKYKSYSSNCQPIQRQPVILTDEEKKRIDKEHPGSYHDKAIQYGTDPNNKYWYICPRYWCFLTNSPITKEEVKQGKCGKIIPEGAHTVPEGAYVYEFKSKDHFDEKGNYEQHYPGFAINDDLHPKGHCLPCCFKNWNKGKQKERKEKCMGSADVATKDALSKTQPHQKRSQYIISLDTFPLDYGRWGFLPVSAQMFVGTNYAAAIDKNNPKVILPNIPVMLRYGVEQPRNQSFMGVFADVYGHIQKKAAPSVREFKEILAREVTLDVFVKIHNASLISVFRPDPLPRINIAKYAYSKIYQKVDQTNSQQKTFLKVCIAAYENFIAYLTDDDEPIDHTYLWDLFTMNIFSLNRGINLVLLEVVENDITDKIELVCPSNSYSSKTYNPADETVIVLKHGEYYEPIYMYEIPKGGGDPKITKTFGENTLFVGVKQMLMNVKHTSRRHCLHRPSLPKVYGFKTPILLEHLVNIAKQYQYGIDKQIINYQGKVIGLLLNTSGENAPVVINKQLEAAPAADRVPPPAAEGKPPQITIIKRPRGRPPAAAKKVAFAAEEAKPTTTVATTAVPMVGGGEVGNVIIGGGDASLFVPCYPSALMDGIPYEYMDDISIWTDYKTTRDGLQRIHQKTLGQIPCNPVMKVIEDGLIVGVITQTHQFVQINPPSENVFMDGLEEIKNTSFYETDKRIATSSRKDDQRAALVKNIQLETQFYSSFRSAFRKLINHYNHKNIRDAIIRIIDDPSLLYVQKLEKVEAQLRKMEDGVEFGEIDREILNDISEITEWNSVSPQQTNYCLEKDDGTHVLVVPKRHLLTGEDNKTVYYFRLADELVRYNRVRLFMFQPKEFLNIRNIDYSIKNDEFIIIHSSLTSGYFDDLIPHPQNSHLKQIPFDFSVPAISQTYPNDVIPLSQQQHVELGEKESDEMANCVLKAASPIVGNSVSMWVQSFPAKIAREMVFSGEPACTFGVLCAIYKDRTKKPVGVNDVRRRLVAAYSAFLPKYLSKIVSILRKQGKHTLMEPVVRGRTTLETLIMGEGYFVSDLDIWMLATLDNLPIVLFSSTFLKGLATKIKWLKLGGRANDKYYFVRSPLTSEYNQRPEYSLVYPNFGLGELGVFSSQYVDATQKVAEYAKCLQSLGEMLELAEFIPKK